MTKLVDYDGKKWKVSKKVIKGTTSNMSVNIASTRTKIFKQECDRHKMWQFRNKEVRANELWMLLADAADENGDDAEIRVFRADQDENWLETIWEGVYGQIPSATQRVSTENIVVPSMEVRIEEGENLMIDLDDDEAITVANSDIEMRAEELLVYRL